jgi:protein YIPF5/7
MKKQQQFQQPPTAAAVTAPSPPAPALASLKPAQQPRQQQPPAWQSSRPSPAIALSSSSHAAASPAITYTPVTDWYSPDATSNVQPALTLTVKQQQNPSSAPVAVVAAAAAASAPTVNPYTTAAYSQQQPQSYTDTSSLRSLTSLEGNMDSSSLQQQTQQRVFVPTAHTTAAWTTPHGTSHFSNHNNSYYPVSNSNAPSLSSGDPLQQQQQQQQQSHHYYDDITTSIVDNEEAPLLEELGINLEHIYLKTRAVVLPSSRRLFGNGTTMTPQLDPAVIVEDADLAGPLAFALLLGMELLLTVKLSFGTIYGFGLSGCVCMTVILNLMAPEKPVSFWTVTSILGYSLLPVNVLAAVQILTQKLAGQETLTRILAVLTVVWSTMASTRLLEVGCHMKAQRYLLAYPIALLYSAFVLITIF